MDWDREKLKKVHALFNVALIAILILLIARYCKKGRSFLMTDKDPPLGAWLPQQQIVCNSKIMTACIILLWKIVKFIVIGLKKLIAKILPLIIGHHRNKYFI